MRLKLTADPAHRTVLLLLALALVRGLIYVSVTPPWQHYDEPGHFEYVAYFARHHRPPTRQSLDLGLRSQIVASLRRYAFDAYQPTWSPPSTRRELRSQQGLPWPQYNDPELYYLLGAGVLSIFPSSTRATQLYALRLMSVALNLFVLTIAAATTRLLFPARPELLSGVLVFIVFLPAYSDVASSVNNDVLANLLFAGVVYLLIRQVVWGTSWPLALATLGTFVLCLFTKRTTAVGLLALLAGILMVSKQQWPKYFRTTVIAIAMLGVLMGLLALGWGANQWPSLWGGAARSQVPGSFSSFVSSFLDWERSLPFYWTTAQVLFKSFWGHFAWGSEAFTPPAYYFLFIITLVALVGLAKLLLGRSSNGLCLNVRQKQAVWLLLFLVVTVWLAALLRVHLTGVDVSSYIPRARYTYVALIPFAILFVLGLRAWIPAGRRDWLVTGLVVGGVLLDTWFLTGYVLPFFLT